MTSKKPRKRRLYRVARTFTPPKTGRKTLLMWKVAHIYKFLVFGCDSAVANSLVTNN